jgi:hypothetical protein
MRYLVICILFALCASAHSTALSDAARQKILASEAYTLAAAEADTELDAGDPRIKKTEVALAYAAKFFNATKKEIAKAVWHYAWQSRNNGVPMTALLLLREGPALAKLRPSLPRDLSGFNTFAEVYIESARFTDLATQQAAVLQKERVLNSPAYALAVAEAGEKLTPFDPRVSNIQSALRVAATHFHASETEISNVAYFHAKDAREKGVEVHAVDILLGAPKAFKKNGPFGKPTLQTFNLYAAVYQRLAKSLQDDNN